MASIFKSLGSLFGGSRPKPTEAPELKTYDPKAHGNLGLVPLARNPNLFAAPGIEDKLKVWDSLKAQFDQVNNEYTTKYNIGRQQNLMESAKAGTGSIKYKNMIGKLRERRHDIGKSMLELEMDIIPGLYKAPAGYQAPAPQQPAPQQPAPQQPAPQQPAPQPTQTPQPTQQTPASVVPTPTVNTPAGNIAGITAFTGTESGGGRGRRRRGRMQTLLGELGGEQELLS